HAKRASDAGRFIDAGDDQRRRDSAAFVDRKRRRVEQVRKRGDRFVAAGRASIDRRVAGGNRFSVGAAALVAAASALRLWQQCIDGIGGNGNECARDDGL